MSETTAEKTYVFPENSNNALCSDRLPFDETSFGRLFFLRMKYLTLWYEKRVLR